MAIRAIPEGYSTITPYLIVDDADAYLAFLDKAFGATPRHVLRGPDNKIQHAELQFGTSRMMLANAGRGFAAAPASYYLYVEDCDAVYRRALDAGAESTMEPADMFYGDRNCGVRDFAGVTWWIGTHLRDVQEEELERLAAERP